MSTCGLLVVGAGPAGAAAAATAAGRGCDVTLLHDPRRGQAWAGESLPPGMPDLVAAVFGAAAIVASGIIADRVGRRVLLGASAVAIGRASCRERVYDDV